MARKNLDNGKGCKKPSLTKTTKTVNKSVACGSASRSAAVKDTVNGDDRAAKRKASALATFKLAYKNHNQTA